MGLGVKTALLWGRLPTARIARIVRIGYRESVS